MARPAPSKNVSVCVGASPYSARVYVPLGVLVVSKMSAYVSYARPRLS
ncbi:hypothetical protein [Streptomyces hawaiiensis]